MALTRRSGRSRFTLALLILTAVTLITLDSRGFEPLDVSREITMGALGPVNDGAGSLLSPIGDAWAGAWRQGDLEDENARLEARIDELEGRESMSSLTERALRDFLAEAGIAWSSDRETLLARVVSGPSGNWDETVEIDAGSGRGVREGMAVRTGSGLVGRIISVSDSRSKVRLITDPSVRIGLRFVDANEVGTASGQGQGRALRVTAIEQDSTVSPGDIAYTTGYARSLFPGDVPVGQVVRVDDNPGDTSKTVLLEPLATLDDLTFVSVILEEPPE